MLRKLILGITTFITLDEQSEANFKKTRLRLAAAKFISFCSNFS